MLGSVIYFDGWKVGSNSNLLEGNSLRWMNLGVELWNGLDLVIPALFFASKSSNLDGAHTLLLCLEAALITVGFNVLAHKGTMMCLWQFHWVKLGPEERNLRALTNGTLDILKDLMAVRSILFQKEGCRIRTSLKVLVWIDSIAALLLRWTECIEANWAVSRRVTTPIDR